MVLIFFFLSDEYHDELKDVQERKALLPPDNYQIEWDNKFRVIDVKCRLKTR